MRRAAQSKCPIFVKKTVWANSATTVERLLSGSAEPEDEDETKSTRALTTIRCEKIRSDGQFSQRLVFKGQEKTLQP